MDRAEVLAASFESAEIIAISLEDGGLYKVQKALLCNTADYFKKALEGDFAESQSKALTLPGCNTPTFKLFLCWICDQRLPEPNWNTLKEPQLQELEVNLGALWILGDFLQLPLMQNDALDWIDLVLCRALTSVEMVDMIFTRTLSDRVLQDYIARQVAEQWVSYDEYDSAAKSAFGAVPGFFEKFVSVMKDCMKACDHEGRAGPYVRRGDLRRWYRS